MRIPSIRRALSFAAYFEALPGRFLPLIPLLTLIACAGGEVDPKTPPSPSDPASSTTAPAEPSSQGPSAEVKACFAKAKATGGAGASAAGGMIEAGITIAATKCEEGNDFHCTVLGRAFNDGTGVAIDPACARDIWLLACNREGYEACLLRGPRVMA